MNIYQCYFRLPSRRLVKTVINAYSTQAANRQEEGTCTLGSRKIPFNLEYDPSTGSILYPPELSVNNQLYSTDQWTNVTPLILSKVGVNLHLKKYHPLNHLSNMIRSHIYKHYPSNNSGHLSPKFSIIDNLSPIVTTEQNFDHVLVPVEHISRTKSNNYYLNKNFLLRSHTSAHQVDLIRSGLDCFLCIGDVYRRDQIDSTHYPVFHQCEGVRLFDKQELFTLNKNVIGIDKEKLEIFENTKKKPELREDGTLIRDVLKQDCHTLEAVKLVEYSLKSTITKLFEELFSSYDGKLNSRWVETTFPFTHPSWEFEVEIDGKWYELLGCGIIEHKVLEDSGLGNHERIGWAFGLGLERIAMIMYKINDIRLFWSTDTGFLTQFHYDDSTKRHHYKPISVYPQCINDISFWLNSKREKIDSMDFYDLVRSIGGDLIEQVHLVDEFYHTKKKRHSQCYRIIYRSMHKTLTQPEVTEIHKQIENECVKQFAVEIR